MPLIATLLIGIGGFSLSGQDDPSSETLLSKVRPIWDARRAEPINGSASCRIYRFYDDNAKQIPREKGLALIAAASERPSRTSLSGMLDGVDTRAWRKEKSTLWDVALRIYVSGTNVRNDFDRPRGTSSLIYDGNVETSYDEDNHQANIQLGRTGMEKLGLAHIRLVPYTRQIDAWLDSARKGDCLAADLGEGWFRIRHPRGELEFRGSDGFIRRSFTLNSKGRADSEIIQVPRRNDKDDAPSTYPAAVFRMTYDNDCIRMLSGYLIDAVDTSAPVLPSTFRLAVAPGTKVFDYRRDPKNPSFRAATMAVEDVVGFMDRALAPGNPDR